MTKVIALMFTTLQCLVATLQAHVITIRIRAALLHGTADILAFVPLARLHDVADLLAGESFVLRLLLRRHQFLLQLAGIVQGVAWDFAFVFLAVAWLKDFLFTSLAAVCVAWLFTGMDATREELFTFVTASWNWVRAQFPLSSNQRLNCVVATWAVPQACRLVRAWSTRTFMASLLAFVFAAIQSLVADLAATLSLDPTFNRMLLRATEAC